MFAVTTCTSLQEHLIDSQMLLRQWSSLPDIGLEFSQKAGLIPFHTNSPPPCLRSTFSRTAQKPSA